ncbi:MAG TPA: hypothetical protein VJA21_03145 [Verrucomicrobiae bacterium]
MRPIEIESWALRILERVEKRLPVEDSRVELKADWLEPVKAARRIAAHANAARGEPILWVIGADEKARTVPGANPQDLANWFPQVKACFESEVPLLQDLNVAFNSSTGAKTVAVLCFDTSRFPYVIKNPKGGEIAFEVPWRVATGVRTATRSDLLLMLSPLIRAPQFELLSGELALDMNASAVMGSFRFELSCYVVPKSEDLIVFPFHKIVAQLGSGSTLVVETFKVKMETPRARAQRWAWVGKRIAPKGEAPAPRTITFKPAPDGIEMTEDELLVRAPGKVFISGQNGYPVRYRGEDQLDLNLTVAEATSDARVAFSGKFCRIKDGKSEKEPNRWALTH